ncbi:TonB-dependent receptor Plug domain-containing protein [Advenella mimigardefordensis DPN7]|uniref:TonB-dependent receptor Plug domain-containing protein n=2 Tax=Advenella mimigardefordensis TaxID=302406 RepID=W0PD79_ADVMD|nr:TonB-dependent receptor Plug domain-containing protein [Advenella mimigardefordensis DPN7]
MKTPLFPFVYPAYRQLTITLVFTGLCSLPVGQPLAFAQQRATERQAAHLLPPVLAVPVAEANENRFTMPSSVSIINRKTLETQHLDTLGEIAHRQPNMHLTSYTHANPVITIRGLGIHVDESDSTNIPVLMDGVSVPSNFVGQLFDLDQVQILRGPQLLEGPNGLGGLVKMRSRDPGLTAAGDVSLEYGSHKRQRATVSGDVPLAGRTGLRIAIGGEQSDGNTYNRTLDRKDTAGWHSTLAKLKLLHTDDGGGQWRLGLYHMNLRGGNDYFAPEDLSRRHESTATEKGANNTKYTLLSGSYQRQFAGDTRLAVTFGASRSEWNYWLPRSLFKAQAGFDMVTRELSADTRLSGHKEAIDWMVGVFAQQARRDAPYQFDMAPYFTSNTLAKRKGHTLALYGQAGWAFARGWRLAPGLRIQHDRQRLNWRSEQRGYMDSDGDGIPDRSFSMTDSLRNASVTKTVLLPTLTLEYGPDERHFGWVKLSRGYEAPGYNLYATKRERAQYAYLPTLANYIELGYRIRGEGDRWELGATAFSTILHDHQVVGSVNGLTVTNNAARAHSRGFELTGMWRPVPELELNAFAGVVDAKWDDFVLNGVDWAGQRFSTSPRQSYGLGLSWQPHAQWSLGASVVRHGRSTLATNSNFVNKPYTLVDAHVTYTGGRFSIGVYGQNLGNAHYYTRAVSQNALAAGTSRNVGIRVSMNF